MNKLFPIFQIPFQQFPKIENILIVGILIILSDPLMFIAANLANLIYMYKSSGPEN